MDVGIFPVNIWVIGGEPGISQDEVVFANMADEEVNGLGLIVDHHFCDNFVCYFSNAVIGVVCVSNRDGCSKGGTLKTIFSNHSMMDEVGRCSTVYQSLGCDIAILIELQM